VLSALIGVVNVTHAQTPAASIADATKPGEVSEVVVTAQRRSERLQDVPITVETVSADTMRT
jgi:iron complex outermembrane receptor protein